MQNVDILVLEDEKKLADLYVRILTKKGFSVKHASNSDDFFSEYNLYNPSLLLLDINLIGSKLSGLEVFKTLIKKNNFKSKVIMLSGEASRSEVAEAMKLGAFTFIEKSGNFNLDKFIVDIQQALNLKIEEEKNSNLKEQNTLLTSKILSDIPFIGDSPEITEIRNLLIRYAQKGLSILIEGETGTGKEVAADFAYWHSPRAGKLFKKVNISALNTSLETSSLFGHKKGAFTGADADFDGFFMQADKGVLFLDEIASISVSTQAMILRAIENNEIEILGGKTKSIDVVYYFATNKPLENLVKKGLFRQDLYYRLTANTIQLPPLRKRGKDIVSLFDYYLAKNGISKNRRDFSVENLFDILSSHPWYGNIRELMNFTNNLVTKHDYINEAIVKKEILNLRKINSVEETSGLNQLFEIENYTDSVNQFSRMYVIEKLKQNNFRILRTAQSIGMTRPTFYRLMKKLDIDKEEIEFFD